MGGGINCCSGEHDPGEDDPKYPTKPKKRWKHKSRFDKIEKIEEAKEEEEKDQVYNETQTSFELEAEVVPEKILSESDKLSIIPIIEEIERYLDRDIADFISNQSTYLHICGEETKALQEPMESKPILINYEGIDSIETFMQENGIHYVCQKGISNPQNQDDFFILVDEATILMGVFDGHGVLGTQYSCLAQALFPKLLMNHPKYKTEAVTAIKETFALIQKTLFSIIKKKGFINLYSGTTGTVLVKCGSNLHIGHVGDSRVYIGRTTEENDSPNLIRVTQSDHTPDIESEKERIEKSNGVVTGNPARVFNSKSDLPGLALSRSIGDEAASYIGVICEPEIITLELTKSDLFVTICSNGIWQNIQEENFLEIMVKNKGRGLDFALNTIAEYAFKNSLGELGKRDDMTCLLLSLQEGIKLDKSSFK